MRSVRANSACTLAIAFALLAALMLFADASTHGNLRSVETGRKLLDYTVNSGSNVSNVTIQAFPPSSGAGPNSQCTFSGIPGASNVPGPLSFNVIQGVDFVVFFQALGGNAVVQLYNQTSDITLTTYFSQASGLLAIDFNANGSSVIGQVSYVNAGRVDGYNPNATAQNQPSCLVKVQFVVVAPSSPPPPPTQTPSPTQASTPAATPAPTSNNNNNGGNNNNNNGGNNNNNNGGGYGVGVNVNVPGVNVNVGGGRGGGVSVSVG